MKKKDVDEQSPASFVVMPLEIDPCFSAWWKDLHVPGDHEVAVRYPFERHGLGGRMPNNAKTDARRNFLEFVDNSQSNGRRSDSSNPTHYFLPNFTTISTPKKRCAPL